jgi:hypothetical protein
MKKSQRVWKQSSSYNTKETLLIQSLICFYRKDPKHIEVLKTFLKNKQRRLSLRLLDWLVTNYAKKHNVIIQKNRTDNVVEFMYLAYKNYLKSYSKKFFDAFARRQRIFYTFDNHVHLISHDEIEAYLERDDGVITTIAQLNAFRFFITYGVIEYAMNHLDSIERDMVQTLGTARKINNDDNEKAPFNTFVVCNIKITVKF